MKPRRIRTDREYSVDGEGHCSGHVRILSEADYRYLRRVEKAAIALLDGIGEHGWHTKREKALRKALGGES